MAQALGPSDPRSAIGRHPWLLGDWNPWLRDGIDVLRLSFLVGAVVTALNGDVSNALRMALTFLLVLAARRLDLPRPLDLAVVAGLGLQAFGNALGLFEAHVHYDKLVHFVLPLAVAPTLYVLLIRLRLVPDLADKNLRSHPGGIVIVTLALGVTVGVVYELYEYLAVHVWGAGLHVGYGDTIADLLDDSLGSLLGGFVLLVWATRGWGTTRRFHAR